MNPFQFFGSLELPGEPTSARTARHFVAHVLSGTGFNRVADTQLMVSELVTNSLRHVGSGLSVAVFRYFATLSVEVTDLGSPHGEPCLTPPSDHLRQGGFGLSLVQALSSGWGSYTAGGNQVTWFTVPYPDPHPEADSVSNWEPLPYDRISALLREAREIAQSLPRHPRSVALSPAGGKERS